MKEIKKKPTQTGLEIAVIGMAGKFPGANDIDTFWENLKNGVESITFFTDDELAGLGIEKETLKKPNYVKAKGYVEDIEYFDSAFFNYTPHEAGVMDPQVRIFHECAWHALENAGYDPHTYNGLIGLYAGYSPNIHWRINYILQARNGAESLEVDYLNSFHFATLLCYKLNLKGPGVSVNTACSTSLVAVHMGCRALLTGEADIILSGGISLTLPSKTGYFYEEGMLLSPDGHCRPFDVKAGGMAAGNGVGIVVLKRLVKAVKDGDHIYAVIKGSAINNDGNRKPGYTAPSVEAQAEVIRIAQRMAEVETESITYIEPHGTGTNLGDPIEFEALKKAFSGTNKKRFCRLGLLKANIGHLDAAAGVVGFIKAVLALHHRTLPPAVNFDSPNPKIDFENSPFYINKEMEEWKSEEYPLRAGVSAYGIGGTNAHVILEEYTPATSPTASTENAFYNLILLSAKTQSALDNMTKNLAEHFKKNPGINVADAIYTLQVGRNGFNYRRMLTYRDKDQAVNDLLSMDTEKARDYFTEVQNRPVVFMFPGPGSQYIDMGLGLYQTEPVFREEMDRLINILKPLGQDIKEKNPGTVTFIFEYALARLMMKWGIKPHAMIGSGMGEYVAACIAGVFSLEDALILVTARGKAKATDSNIREFEATVGKVTLNKPEIPFISSVTGKRITPEDAVNPRYWAVHLKETDRISEGLKELMGIENTVFIEVGPGASLSTLALSIEQKESNRSVVNIVRPRDLEIPDKEYLINQVGQLWLYGVKIDWPGFYGGEKRMRIPLPPYPFDKNYYSVDLQLKQLFAGGADGATQFFKQGLPPTSPDNRPESKTPYEAPRNKAEEILARMWEDLLGIHPIGVHDNLIEMGVDSLKGIMFVNRFKEQSGDIIQVSAVFDAPTISEFATYFSANFPESIALTGAEQLGVSTIPGNLMMLNGSQEAEINVFFVHEICGDVGAYLEFSKHLGGRFNCWGIEAEKLKNFVPQNVSIEEISAKYIEQMKKIQPRGPYSIATWSFGGNLGIEMALQLEKMGEEIKVLAFFDCFGPNGRLNDIYEQYTLENEKTYLKNFFVGTENADAFEKIEDIDQLWMFVVDYVNSDPRLVEGLRQMLIEYEQAIPNYNGLKADELIQYLNLSRSFKCAGSQYIPSQKINTPLHYYLARDTKGRIEYWGEYCNIPVVYHEISGDHHSIFRNKEQIVEFAQKFKELLEELNPVK